MLITRHVVRGWLFPRIVLEVADPGIHRTRDGVFQLHKPWRRATKADLISIEAEKQAEWNRTHTEIIFKPGTKVKVKANAGFDRGAEGRVVFQEPNGGRVWMQRKGSSGPCYYYPDEILKWPAPDYRIWLTPARQL